MKKLFLSLLLASSAWLAAQERPQVIITPAPEPWTVSRLENTIAGRDPIEGFNRSMFAVTDVLMDYIVHPVGWVYCSILPRPVIDAFERVCLNLEYPAHLFASLGCAEWTGAWDETVRFFVNTTVGIGGLFDPAQKWMHYYPTYAGFGRMFRKWGIGPGCTFILPMGHAANVRDNVGWLFDIAFDLKTYLPYTSWIYFNRAERYQPGYASLMQDSPDKYHTWVMLLLMERELNQQLWMYTYCNNMHKAAKENKPLVQYPPERKPYIKPLNFISEWITIPGYMPQDPYIDSLRVSNFMAQKDEDFWYLRQSIFNSDFIETGRTRKVRVHENRDKMRYVYYDLSKDQKKQNLPERLIFLIPGIGSSAKGSVSVAMAELFHNAGYKVAVLQSAFYWEFMQTAGNDQLPGYALKDVQNILKCASAVRKDLKEREDISNPQISFTGWSMGGFHTLHLAALSQTEKEFPNASFIALNPPVDMKYSFTITDKMTKASAAWPCEVPVRILTNVAGQRYLSAGKVIPPYAPPKPLVKKDEKPAQEYRVDLSRDQAEYLISLNFSQSIGALILKRHQEKPFPWIKAPCTVFNRHDFYTEINGISFGEYAEKYVAPQYPGTSVQKVIETSGIRAISPKISGKKNVRIIHTYDDVLLSDADKNFLDKVFSKQLTWFAEGGHCGQFYTVPFQQKLIALDQECHAASSREK